MQIVGTDWPWSPPALGLALSQGRSSSTSPTHGEGPALDLQVTRECIVPALEATSAADFVREVSRRLPLFAALHIKLLDDVFVMLGVVKDLPTISQAYEAMEATLRRWAARLDDVAQTELEIAVSTLNRSNQLLLSAADQESRPADVADLFRTAILVEFLLSCLWQLVKLDERPPIAVQIIYNLRYAVLDYAAAVRIHLGRLDEPGPEPSSSERSPEDSFWATVGILPLTKLGDDA